MIEKHNVFPLHLPLDGGIQTTSCENIHDDVIYGNKSMIRVIITACGTIVAGLLSTIVVILVTQL